MGLGLTGCGWRPVTRVFRPQHAFSKVVTRPRGYLGSSDLIVFIVLIISVLIFITTSTYLSVQDFKDLFPTIAFGC